MKKPWEEEWMRHESQAGEWLNVGRGGELVATFYAPERRRLAEAAPDMARALSDLLRHARCHASVLADGDMQETLMAAAAALTKAGVPLP